MKKQGYSSRKDESLGMKNGRESKMKQSYKSRRDESYGMKNSMKEMGHASKPRKCDAFAAQKSDLNRLKPYPMNNDGQPSQAWDYKY